MYVFKHAFELKNYLSSARQAGKSIGFVPTMGALHDGHLQLIAQARQHTDLVVCSIFVNPTQFNDPKDYEKYPSTIAQDTEKLVAAGNNVLFLPAVAEMYPEGLASTSQYDFGYLETLLEGSYRPGHFQGVGRVMHKLLKMIMPHQVFMGQKDFQQCMIVKRLLEITGLPAQLVISPTTREASGLAMSSRNMRLSAEERQTATLIYQVLTYITQHRSDIDYAPVVAEATRRLVAGGFVPDYVAIADAATLLPITGAIPGKQVALIAAKLGEVRLIDNVVY
ncbi:pantothenate synthetase [Chitinophaga costaii]|uniref:Pantothenate synthetase n=1 Tax=Chitinophaga costaii TaxID=1335309 RepID=A0A1C4FJJ2_9BACT|nr:pantoate--beta-alanine ligase [Chitinophaga costaii]PUZ20332.1 pantoate--beta-alanine ligase [Chitinophaga costaii]SCC55813.1 pantothenate synthetase [Chitinophaga costaii]